jgi:hypothetical protein
VYALLVVATITAVLAIFAVWVQRQVLDGENWTRSSSELLDDPAIRAAVSGYLVDELYANVDVAGELRAALPPRARPLAAPAAGGLRTVAGNVTDEALQRPRVQALWENANRRAHARLLKVLEGGGPALQTTGGVVTLDVDRLLSEIAGRTGVGGRLAAKIQPGSADITLLRSEQLGLAQNVVNAIRPLAIVLTGLALALYGLAIWLARGWHREALRAAGVGFVVAGIATLLGRRIAGVQLVDALATTAAVRPAVESVWRIETSLLVDVAQATIAYGVVAVLAAWLAGRTNAATATRKLLAPYLREPGHAYGGLAVVMLLLLVWAPTQALRQPVTALLLIALVAGGFEVLRRQTAREFPDVERQVGLQVRAALGRLGGSNGHRRSAPADGGQPAPSAVPTAAAASGPAAAVAPAVPDPLDRLERASALHERGALTDDEFAVEKREILAAR